MGIVKTEVKYPALWTKTRAQPFPITSALIDITQGHPAAPCCWLEDVCISQFIEIFYFSMRILDVALRWDEPLIDCYINVVFILWPQ